MDKREKFVEKMVELLALGEKIVDEFYEKYDDGENDMPAFVDEIEYMNVHMSISLNILKETMGEENE